MPKSAAPRLFLGAALLASLASGCAAPEPSPRSVSMWRAHVIALQVAPAAAVLQGEGGPIEVTVKNAGMIPVRAFDVEAQVATDDGAPVEADAKGAWPELAPGESGKATLIVRPIETGDEVTHQFRVLFIDSRVKETIHQVVESGDAAARPAAKPILRSQGFDVKVQVQAAPEPVAAAREKAKAAADAPAIHSGTLGAWAFDTPGGAVLVPAEGETVTWPGVTLRAIAWIDLLAGDKIPLRFESEAAREKLAVGVELAEDATRGRTEALIDDAKVASFLDFASKSGLKVETLLDGTRRLLLVKQ